MFKKLRLAALIALLSSSSMAGLLVEPYLGFNIAGGENSNAIKTTYDYTTPVLGGRLGYSFLGLMAGIDYSMSLGTFEMETKALTVTNKQDYTQNTFGLFAGYEFPILLRAWASYFMSSKLKGDGGTVDGDEFSGSGMGLGVGFTGLPFVAINLEYRMMKYDEAKDNSAGTTSNLNGNDEIDVNELMLSVSLPLDL